MSRDPGPATNDPRPRRTPWRLVYGDGGAGPAPSASIAPMDGATNMAIDVALLEAVKAGGAPVLRLYRWSPACLSFGRNQPARGRYDPAEAAARGIDLVRRPTGGQAVLHDDELTYAVIAPVSVIGKPRAAYGRINEALVAGLSRLGVRAALAESGGRGIRGGTGSGGDTAGDAAEQPSSGPDWDAACFRRPERGEVVAGGAKLVGSAQRMESRTILQHGSILVGGSQAAAEELLVAGAGVRGASAAAGSASSPGWTTLVRELEARPGFEHLADVVMRGFADVLGIELEGAALTAAERAEADRQVARFGSDEWTWRR